MVAPVVGALAWRWMFVDGYGMIDSIASWFGGGGPLWFANIWLARAAIVITNLWLALPFDILMLVAGLASLPSEPIEAARVDGASPLQTLRLVILPLLKPVIAIILVIRFADAFRIFDVVYVLTGSGPGNSTDVLSTFIYRQMFFKFDFAGGSAASILLVGITALASILAVVGAAPRAGNAMSGTADTPLRSALGSFGALPSPYRRLPALRHSAPLDRLDLIQDAGRDLHHADDAPSAAPDDRELQGGVRRRLPLVPDQQPDRGERRYRPWAALRRPRGLRLRTLSLSLLRAAPLLHCGHPHFSADRARFAVLPAISGRLA